MEPQEKRLARASCIDGMHVCPPDDCGGPPGYDRMLKILKKPKHPQYGVMLEWLGGGFDPKAFEFAATNDMLAGVKV